MSEFRPRRCVYHLGGFDPMTPEATLRRFEREMTRFETTWMAKAQVAAGEVSADQALWRVSAEGPDWRSQTEHRLIRWDDVIMAARNRPHWRRVPQGFAALMDFVLNGALWSYLRTAWRYAGFFLYPLVILLAMAGLSVFAGVTAARYSASALAGLVAAPLVFYGLVASLGQRLYLDHLLDDWIFARDCLDGLPPLLDTRLNRIAAEIDARQGAEPDTEILIVGHSLGAVIAIDLLDRILTRAQGPAPVRLMTIGSSILKIGFNRRARWLHAALSRVGASARVIWVEYQALNDVMNFYRRDPLGALGIAGQGPLLRKARFSRMLDTAAYAKIKRNLFRLHCQFVSGNTRRSSYDYFMITCGPFTLEQVAAAPEGVASLTDEDGHPLTPAIAPAGACP